MGALRKPQPEFDLLNVIDPEDSTPHPVMGRMVTVRGILKMASCAAFHDDDPVRREASRLLMERFLAAAEAKGWLHAETYRGLFSSRLRPVDRARKLANEVVGLLSCAEQNALLDGTEPEGGVTCAPSR